MDLLGGVSYNRENFSNSVVRNSAEAYWGDDLAYKLKGSTSLTQSFRMFNNLSDLGAYRMNFDLGTLPACAGGSAFRLLPATGI